MATASKKRSIIIRSQSRHTMCVTPIDRSGLPMGLPHSEGFTKFWVVQNFDTAGCVFMYLGTGRAPKPKEICAWYRNGKFWSSYGLTLQAAIDGAQRDGWLDAADEGVQIP